MHIHFIAIGGAIMHQLAIALKNKGYVVTGSDDEINDPALSNLSRLDLLPERLGWFPEKLTPGLDAVILGMHAKKDNPELKRAKELGLKIYSFPEYIYELSKDKKRVVIAGSHGKTTTTSMIMHVLQDQGIDFDYLVGAKVEGFPNSVHISSAPLIILEGDEYPASVLEKRPKIHFYRPHISVLTGIAWDHVNVFPSYDIYKEQFSIYLENIENGALLIYNEEDEETDRLAKEQSERLRTIPFRTPPYRLEENVTWVGEPPVALHVFGDHNLRNLEAAKQVCVQLGISESAFYQSMGRYKGASRRLEKIEEHEGFVAYRDFAHAPSKLKATLDAVRKQYPQHRLVACFELHTFSSLNEKFLKEYAHSLDQADDAAVFFSLHALQLKGLPLLESQTVKECFRNDRIRVFKESSRLKEWLQDSISTSDRPVCLLLMSSGTFENMDLAFIKKP